MNGEYFIREIGSAFGFDIGSFNDSKPWVVFVNSLYANMWALQGFKFALLRAYKFPRRQNMH